MDVIGRHRSKHDIYKLQGESMKGKIVYLNLDIILPIPPIPFYEPPLTSLHENMSPIIMGKNCMAELGKHFEVQGDNKI